jgi:hypothetical protein
MAAQESGAAAPAPSEVAQLRKEAAELRALLEKLEKRIDQIESAASGSQTGAPAANAVPPAAAPAAVAAKAPEAPAAATVAPPTGVAGLLAGTTLNVLLDTYYEYNFNAPIGRVNLLRAYDVSSNLFSLNQAVLMLENAPNPDAGKRWGVRVDLQWGQATESLQGNVVNEPRPDVYRNIFQAYGTYVAPIGRGLTVDFGKWASSLGLEGNYTQDQLNYSRSFLFNFLPFYHMGVRANYAFSDQFSMHYWVINGTNQTEAYNGFKDESVGFTWQPAKPLSWTFNYYRGQEHPDEVYYPNGAPAGIINPPTQQGVAFEPIGSPATGKLNIIDSYLTWQVSKALSFGLEGDWVIQRLYTNSAPARVDGGAIYGHYQFTPKFGLAARAEYVQDHGGMFSGITQDLKEATLTADYKLADNLLLRWEWRRDLSNRPYFYTPTLNSLKVGQTTAGLGVVWWFGGKQSPW